MGYCIQEALRLNPVATTTSLLKFENDTRLGNLRYKANTMCVVNMFGLHRNAKQWQRPHEYLPDRFDPDNELSLTPDGKKRHNFSWLPFSGGKRICFGKTFAEFVIKMLITMMTQRFEMSFVEKEKFSKGKLPMKVINQSHMPKLWVQLKERK